MEIGRHGRRTFIKNLAIGGIGLTAAACTPEKPVAPKEIVDPRFQQTTLKGRELAVRFPKLFSEAADLESQIIKLTKSGELVIDSTLPPQIPSSVQPELRIAKSTNTLENPTSTIHISPSFLIARTEDQVIGLLQLLAFRDKQMAVGLSFANKPADLENQNAYRSKMDEQSRLSTSDIIYKTCQRIENIKQQDPNYQIDIRVFPKFDSIYNVYQKVQNDPNPNMRNVSNPIWRHGLAQNQN